MAHIDLDIMDVVSDPVVPARVSTRSPVDKGTPGLANVSSPGQFHRMQRRREMLEGRQASPGEESSSGGSDCEFLALSDDEEVGMSRHATLLPSQENQAPTQRPVRGVTSIPSSGHSATLRLPAAITTSSFLLDVLESRISVTTSAPAVGANPSDPIISEVELRALLTKALLWFVDRECIEDIWGSHIVFVGREQGQNMDTSCPASPIEDLRGVAQELPFNYLMAHATEDFDEYMFHAGRYLGHRPRHVAGMALHVHIIIAVAVIYVATFFTTVA